MSDDAAVMVDRYLNELCWAMGGKLAEQQAVRDELRAHIDEAARDAKLDGLGALDAARRALGDLGDPSEVGRLLRSSRGSAAIKRPLVQPDGALVLAARRDRHLPHPALVAAFCAGGAMATIVAVAYVWPG